MTLDETRIRLDSEIPVCINSWGLRSVIGQRINKWSGTLMAENNQETQGLDASTQQDTASDTGDKQSMLLKLAERTVVQAEALAQEITENARQESEAAGAKIIAEATDKAKSEAQQTIDSAKSRADDMLAEASAEAQSESEKSLTTARSESEKLVAKAQADSEKIVTRAKEESEKILSEARSASEATLGAAQTDVTEIVGMARQEAQSIISVAQTRAASTESNARLQAEFFIRQTTQSVADGIRASVLDICNNLLPTVAGHQYSEEEFGKNAPEVLGNDESASLGDDSTPMLGGANSAENAPAPESNAAPKPGKARASKKSIAS